MGRSRSTRCMALRMERVGLCSARACGRTTPRSRKRSSPTVCLRQALSDPAPTNVGGFRYVAEQDGSAIGDLRLFRFHSSENGIAWDLVANGEMAGGVDTQQTVMMAGAGTSSTARPRIQNDFVALRTLSLAQEPLAGTFNELPPLHGYFRWALATMPSGNATTRAPTANPDAGTNALWQILPAPDASGMSNLRFDILSRQQPVGNSCGPISATLPDHTQPSIAGIVFGSRRRFRHQWRAGAKPSRGPVARRRNSLLRACFQDW